MSKENNTKTYDESAISQFIKTGELCTSLSYDKINGLYVGKNIIENALEHWTDFGLIEKKDDVNDYSEHDEALAVALDNLAYSLFFDDYDNTNGLLKELESALPDDINALDVLIDVIDNVLASDEYIPYSKIITALSEIGIEELDIDEEYTFDDIVDVLSFNAVTYIECEIDDINDDDDDFDLNTEIGGFIDE